jgi:hypothetical protein
VFLSSQMDMLNNPHNTPRMTQLAWDIVYFRLELESAQEPVQREWLLRQIREAEQEYLDIMTRERERLEQENANMEEALRRIRAMEARKKK